VKLSAMTHLAGSQLLHAVAAFPSRNLNNQGRDERELEQGRNRLLSKNGRSRQGGVCALSANCRWADAGRELLALR
jgi:hypothetical protein